MATRKKKESEAGPDLVGSAAELGKPVLKEIPAEGEIAVAVDPWALLADALDALARVEYKMERGGVFHLILHAPNGGTVPFSCVHGGRKDLTERMEAINAVLADVKARIDSALL